MVFTRPMVWDMIFGDGRGVWARCVGVLLSIHWL